MMFQEKLISFIGVHAILDYYQICIYEHIVKINFRFIKYISTIIFLGLIYLMLLKIRLFNFFVILKIRNTIHIRIFRERSNIIWRFFKQF